MFSVINARLRVFQLIGLAICVGGCAMQPRDQVRVNVGPKP
jgi:hypothetical protein